MIFKLNPILNRCLLLFSLADAVMCVRVCSLEKSRSSLFTARETRLHF